MVQTKQKYKLILEKQGIEVIEQGLSADGVDVITITPESIVDAADFLKKNLETSFNMLVSISGVDTAEHFEVVYHLFSTKNNQKLVLKCKLDKNNPEIPSISNVFSTANWHERETYDLFGIKFLNHPDLKRILLPNDWIGHPLRKDYVINDERLSWNER